MNIILASKSPRRKELLTFAGIEHTVIESNVEEILNPNLSPLEQVQSLAMQKADAVSNKYFQETVIGVDTIVILDNLILGKPVDKADAIQTLKNLSGRYHEVMTAVCILNKHKNICETFVSITEVEFYEMSENWIIDYVDKGEPMDKAGSYGIQGSGFELVKRINGDYYSVVGLPIAQLKRTLKDLDLF